MARVMATANMSIDTITKKKTKECSLRLIPKQSLGNQPRLGIQL